jgi:hypothetical protein
VVFTGGHGPVGPGQRAWSGARPHRGRAAGSEGRHDPTFDSEAPGRRRRAGGGPSRQSGPGSVSGLGVRLGGSGRPRRAEENHWQEAYGPGVTSGSLRDHAALLNIIMI